MELLISYNIYNKHSDCNQIEVRLVCSHVTVLHFETMRPAQKTDECRKCKGDISEKTLVEPRGGIEIESSTIH